MSKPEYPKQPLWRSIRGVGRDYDVNPGHTRDRVALGTVPYRDDQDYQGLETTQRQHLLAATPIHHRCGLPADRHWPNSWWCHYCWEEVKTGLNPNSMIPKTYSTATHYAPPLTDPKSELFCSKCASTFAPRADNQGFICPKCGATHWPEGARRASPTNGF